MSKLVKRLLIVFFILLITILFVVYYSFNLAPLSLTVRYENIRNSKISEKFEGMSICFFSDTHYGLFTDEERLEKVIEIINKQNCDIVIFLGDLFDQNATLNDNNNEIVIRNLNNIQANYGKFAIYGDHDLINNTFKSNYEMVLEKSGFELLCNENIHLSLKKKSYLNLIALDSEANGIIDIDSSFNDFDTNDYNLVICHTPDTIDKLNDFKFDLMISAHSHAGQVNIPLIGPIFTFKYGQKYTKGKYYIDNKILDITSGIGNTKYNVRFLTTPEIVVYKFYAK